MLKALAVLSLPGILAGGFAFGTSTLVGRDPAPTQWVVWGGEAFSNPGELAQWLRARGLAYETWAARHPNAAARLEGRRPPQVVTETVTPRAAASQAPSEKPKPQNETPAGTEAVAAPPPGSSSEGPAAMLLTIAILAAALALVTLASLPLVLLQRIRIPAFLQEHRPELAAAGISMAVGLSAAHLL